VNAWSGRARVLGSSKMPICGNTIEIEIDAIYAIVWRNE
jgi:hypothetical protein